MFSAWLDSVKDKRSAEEKNRISDAEITVMAKEAIKEWTDKKNAVHNQLSLGANFINTNQ